MEQPTDRRAPAELVVARDCPFGLERLRVCPETLDLLRDRGIAVQVLQTEKAVARYNELSRRAPVGGLFHSTC